MRKVELLPTRDYEAGYGPAKFTYKFYACFLYIDRHEIILDIFEILALTKVEDSPFQYPHMIHFEDVFDVLPKA